MIAAHIDRYHDRPHQGLDYRTPNEVRATWDDAQDALQEAAPEVSTPPGSSPVGTLLCSEVIDPATVAKAQHELVGNFEFAAGRLVSQQSFLAVRSFNAAYRSAAMIRAVTLGGMAHFIWSHAGVYGPTRGRWMYATMQLIGDNGEQWARFHALVGGGGTVGSDLLSTIEDLRAGVSGLSSKDQPLTK